MTPIAPLRLLLIAPDPLARSALASMLAAQDAVSVVGQVDGQGDWFDAVDLYGAETVLVDVGWQNSLVVPDLREMAVPVLALVADVEAANQVWQAGARGIVARDVSAETVTNALMALSNGLLVLAPDLLPSPLQPTTSSTLLAPLTAREQDVLNLLAQGKTNRAIAVTLDISDHTVKFHVNALMSKLNAQSRTEAAVKATRMGLISL